MNKPVLVIMAAGMGSRFGGLKQITPVDEQGHTIIDFSLYDAWRAGFRDLVFIIKPEMEETFRNGIGQRMSKYFQITYVHQTIDALPSGYTVPIGREKPWGTGHAILCCKRVLSGPFAVINADDFYGSSAFAGMFHFLSTNKDISEYAMVGYRVRNTVTEHGCVARGVCDVENDTLTGITERTKIYKNGTDVKYTEDGETFISLPGDTVVSMNFWGFTTKLLEKLDAGFAPFLDKTRKTDPLKGEYFLPSVVNEQLQAGDVKVRVLPCEESWYGVTYREDLDSVKSAICAMKAQGMYDDVLWK